MDETKEILDSLPRGEVHGLANIRPNAYIHIDKFGRLSIFPMEGGWLGAELKDVVGDLAPFSD